MADKLSAEEIAKFKAAFTVIDIDGGGSIELRELLTCAAEFNYDISLDELRSVVALVDTDGSGSIEIDEFLEIMGLMLYRHKLESSDDEDEDDDIFDRTMPQIQQQKGASKNKITATSSQKRSTTRNNNDDDDDGNLDLDAILSTSSAVSPEDKAKVQSFLKSRAAWAADVVQQLHNSLANVESAAKLLSTGGSGSAASDGGGSLPGDGGGGNIAAFQRRKQLEAAQAQHRLAIASAARLSKRILLEAKRKGITPRQLPQIESLELEDDPVASAAPIVFDQDDEEAMIEAANKAAAESTENNNSSGSNPSEGAVGSVDPQSLLKSLAILASQLKSAADALGANLKPMSMVKPQHTRGGGSLLAAAAGGGVSAARIRKGSTSVISTRRKSTLVLNNNNNRNDDLDMTFTDHSKNALLSDDMDSMKPVVNKSVLESKLSELSAYDVGDGTANSSNNNTPQSRGFSRPSSATQKGADGRSISMKTMDLVTGDGNIPSSNKKSQLASGKLVDPNSSAQRDRGGNSSSSSGTTSRAADQLRAVAKQVLRSWAFPITPVCDQLDQLDDRWDEFLSLLRGQEALTRPACPLGRACPDRYNHAHRLQLTHPCYCRIDTFSSETFLTEDKNHPNQTGEKKEDYTQPLSEAGLCPHMVRPVHGSCYTHLPPSSNGDVQELQSTMTMTKEKQKAFRLGQLISLVGRLDVSSVELGGVGSQAVAFVIAQDVAHQDELAASGDNATSPKYSIMASDIMNMTGFGFSASSTNLFGGNNNSSATTMGQISTTSSSNYKFKDIIMNKCCISPSGAIALFRVAHNLRSLDLSNNSVGLKTVVIGSEHNEKNQKEKMLQVDPNAPQQNNKMPPPPPAFSSSFKDGKDGKPKLATTKKKKKPTEDASSPGAGKPPRPTPNNNKKLAKSTSGSKNAKGEENTNSNNKNDKDSNNDTDAASPSPSAAAADQQQQQQQPQAPPAQPSMMGVQIRELLYKNGNLTYLNLAGNKLTDSDGTGIAEGLRQNVVLRSLDISHNELGPRFGKELATAMLDNMDLRCLRLAYNPLEATGTQSLLDELKNSSVIEELDLTWTGMGQAAAQALGEMITGCQALTKVCVGNNSIGLNGMISLSKSLPSTRALAHLDVSNNAVAELGVVEMLTGLRTNSSLAHLDISGCSSSSAGQQTIMKEIALVLAERSSKMPPDTPQCNVIFESSSMSAMGAASSGVPAHLTAPDEPIKLQKIPKTDQQQQGSSSRRRNVGSASSSSPKK